MDLSQLSDDDLMRAAGMSTSGNGVIDLYGDGTSTGSATPAAGFRETLITPVNNSFTASSIDYSALSDDDLMKAAGIEPQPSKQAELGNNKGGAQSFVQGFNSAVPFGNRITAGLAAATLAPFTDLTTSELYAQARDDQRVTEESNPDANLAGNIAGIATSLPVGFSKAAASTPVLGGAANALTRGSQAAGNYVGGASSLGGRALRGAVVAAPAGAVYGYGNSESEGFGGDRLADSATGAGLAAAAGFALPIAGAAIKEVGKESANAVRGVFARSGDKLDDAASALFKESSAAYKKMRDIGATINQPGVRDIGKKIDDALLNDGPLNQGLHGNTLSVVQQLKDEMAQPDFSLEKLDQFRRLLSRIPRTAPEDARKAQIVIGALDDAVENIGITSISKGGKDAVDALTQARAAYTKASKFDRVKDIIDASGGDANKLKRSLEKAFQNDKFTRGFTADEKAALQYAARNSTTEGLLKLGGKFGIDLGSSLSVGNAGLPALFGAATTATSGASTAGLGIAAGTAARQAQKYVSRAKAEQLLKVIERGGKVSPQQIKSINPTMLQQSLQNNTLTLGQLQQAFQAKKGIKP